MIHKLNKRVKVQSETNAPDGQGGHVKSWVDVATLWCGLEPKTAKEFLRAEGIANEVTHIARLRYRSDIEPDMRVNFGNRNFQILSVINPKESNHYIELTIKELV